MTTNIIKDLSTLSTVPEKVFAKLIKKMVYCICETVEEDILNQTEITELDIGIGKLYLKYVDDNGSNIKYHFEPSQYLKDSLYNTITNKKNILEDVLNESLVDKFVEVYKEIC